MAMLMEEQSDEILGQCLCLKWVCLIPTKPKVGMHQWNWWWEPGESAASNLFLANVSMVTVACTYFNAIYSISDTVLSILHVFSPHSSTPWQVILTLPVSKWKKPRHNLPRVTQGVNLGLESGLFSSNVSGLRDILFTLSQSPQLLSLFYCH